MTISNRQPAGVPTGGQFTAGKRDESPTQLEAPAFDPVASARRAELYAEIRARQEELVQLTLAELKAHISSKYPTAAYMVCSDDDDSMSTLSYSRLLDASGQEVASRYSDYDTVTSTLVSFLDGGNTHGWEGFTLDRYNDETADELYEQGEIHDEQQVLNLALLP